MKEIKKKTLCLPSSDKLRAKGVQLNKDLSYGEIIKKDVVQVFSDAAKATFDYLPWFNGFIIYEGGIRGEGVASSKEVETRAVLIH